MLAFFIVATSNGKPFRTVLGASVPRGAASVTLLLVILAAVYLLVSTFYGFANEKRLVVSGCVALARVTDQDSKTYQTANRIRHRSVSYVSYEFESAPGKIVRWSGQDPTNSLAEGMIVPVFYDPINPKKQIAACGSSYEVVLTPRA